MLGIIRKESALRAGGFSAFWAMVIMGLGAMVWPSEAMAWTGQPLAYVTNFSGGTVSVIDTGDNMVVDTVSVGQTPGGVAVAPDGKHVYVLNTCIFTCISSVSVIETANETDKVVATILLDPALAGRFGGNPSSFTIAVTPDGKQVFATTGVCNQSIGCLTPGGTNQYVLWVMDTATNTIVADQLSPGTGVANGIAFSPDGKHAYVAASCNGECPTFPFVFVFDTGNIAAAPTSISIPTPNAGSFGIAITPDGKRAYVASNLLYVIDTTTNMLVTSIPNIFGEIAVAPDGKHVYAGSSVIDTTKNTVVATFPVVGSAIAVTPDGKYVYLTGSNSVSVIDTTHYTLAATVSVPGPVLVGPTAIAIIPPPQGIQFLSFNDNLDINLGRNPDHDSFSLASKFILSSTASNGIHPGTEPVKLQVGPFIGTIPAGSFIHSKGGSYTYKGVINGVQLEAKIESTGTLRYVFHAEANGANLSGTTNPVQVSLGIGDDVGLTFVQDRSR
jgi:YVTN family beta-propeller protein